MFQSARSASLDALRISRAAPILCGARCLARRSEVSPIVLRMTATCRASLSPMSNWFTNRRARAERHTSRHLRLAPPSPCGRVEKSRSAAERFFGVGRRLGCRELPPHPKNRFAILTLPRGEGGFPATTAQTQGHRGEIRNCNALLLWRFGRGCSSGLLLIELLQQGTQGIEFLAEAGPVASFQLRNRAIVM